MTDKEKELVVDAIVKIAEITADECEHEAAEKISKVTKKLEEDLGIVDECDKALRDLLFKYFFETIVGAMAKASKDCKETKDD